MAIHLQDVGKIEETVKASDLRVGDVVMFNFGLLNSVVGYGKQTDKFVELAMYSHETQTTTMAKYKKDKELCVVQRTWNEQA